MSVEINCTGRKCHNLSILNSCDDVFIIEPCLIEKDKENNNVDIKLISRVRLSCLEAGRCDWAKKKMSM